MVLRVGSGFRVMAPHDRECLVNHRSLLHSLSSPNCVSWPELVSVDTVTELGGPQSLAGMDDGFSLADNTSFQTGQVGIHVIWIQ
jgi:hypothetical protein